MRDLGSPNHLMPSQGCAPFPTIAPGQPFNDPLCALSLSEGETRVLPLCLCVFVFMTKQGIVNIARFSGNRISIISLS